MNRAEALGAQLVMLIRREHQQQADLQQTQIKINHLYAEIQGMDPGEIYAHTGEIPVQRPVNERVTEIRPLRSDHVDGGHTYNLAAVAETLNMPAVAVCPGSPECWIDANHVHYADGKIMKLREWAPETS